MGGSRSSHRHSTINFEALRYLLVSADTGKLGRAARELGIETASLSRRVQRVEDELGLTVFERGHGGLRVTKAGAAVLVQARRLMADLGALKAVGAIGALGEAGEIRLGVRLPTVGEPIQSILGEWRARFPGVDLKVFEWNEHEIRKGLEDRRLDAAFITKHSLWPQAVGEPLYREALFVALPSAHPLARRHSLTWKALRGEIFLVQGWEDNQVARELYSRFLGSGVRYASHSASKQSVLGLVASGFGITLVTSAQAHVKIPGVKFRSIREDNAELEVEIVWVPENEDAVAGRFVAFMRELVQSRKLF